MEDAPNGPASVALVTRIVACGIGTARSYITATSIQRRGPVY
jgi:hypothetical protein